MAAGGTLMGSVRLDSKIKDQICQVAALKGLTLSDVHRQALAEYCERELSETKPGRYDDPFYDTIFGAFEGPADLSRRAKEIFHEIMDEKYK